MTIALLACCTGSGSFVTERAAAADPAWPARPIRIVVAQAPGGPPDLIARFVAEPLGKALGAPVVVENRPGASGIIGIEHAARAAPDGYTLLIATLSTHVLVPHVNGGVPYDPVRDFVPIANLFRSIKVVWVDPALPAFDLAEFIAYARARPGQLNYATGGVGSSNHVDAAMFTALTGLDLVHVPYNGPSAGIAAVASGQVQMMIVSITTGLPLLQNRKIRPLAVLAARRAALLPEVRTAAEQSLGEFDVSAWIGLMAPAGTLLEIVDRVNVEIDRILRSPNAIAWAERQGLEIAGGSPAAFARTVEADVARWGEVIRRMQLRPQ